jgi:hypothetical protein
MNMMRLFLADSFISKGETSSGSETPPLRTRNLQLAHSTVMGANVNKIGQ